MKFFAVCLTVSVAILSLGVIVGRWWVGFSFDRGCGNYLTLASNAGEVKLATEYLDKSIAYLNEHKYTEGNTAILWPTPSTDVALWYKNIVVSRDELQQLAGQPSVAQTNALMKLRESLTDHVDGNIQLTMPGPVWLMPYRIGWAAATTFAWIYLTIFGLVAFIVVADKSKH